MIGFISLILSYYILLVFHALIFTAQKYTNNIVYSLFFILGAIDEHEDDSKVNIIDERKIVLLLEFNR